MTADSISQSTYQSLAFVYSPEGVSCCKKAVADAIGATNSSTYDARRSCSLISAIP